MNDPIDSREPLFSKDGNTSVPTDGDLRLDNTESEAFHKDFSVDVSSAHQPPIESAPLDMCQENQELQNSEPEQVVSSEIVTFSETRKAMRYQYPPQIELAQIHANCVLYGCKQLSEEEASQANSARNLICRCCNTERPPMLPLCKNPYELHFYGPMLPLYFNMLWFVIFLAGVMLVACVFAEVKIVKANCNGGTDKYSKEPYPCKWSNLGTYINPNARNTENKYFESDPLFMTWSILVFYFLHRMYVDSEKKMISDLRKKHPMISQFTVMVSNLSPEERTPEYVQAVLQDRCEGPLPPPLLFNFANRAGTKLGANKAALADVQAKSESLNSALASDTCNEDTRCRLTKRVAYLQAEAKNLQRSIANLTASKNSSSRMANGVVFVTFGSTAQKDLIKVTSGFWRALYVMFPSCHKKKVHIVEAAYDPDDVRWDKIGFTGVERFRQQLLMLLLFVFGFGIAFSIQIEITIALLNIIRYNIQGGKISKPQLPWEQSMYRSLLFKLISVSNILSNYAISQLIKFISNQQHHISNTHSYMTRTLRMVTAQMIKTIAINTTIHYSMEDPTDYTILSEMVFNYFLMNIFMSPLLSAFRPSYLFKVYLKRWWATRKLRAFVSGKSDAPGVALTQRDLNELYDPPMIDMPARYTGLYKTLCLAAYYLELVPSCALLTLIYLVVQYWADKYMILRVYSPPIRLNEILSLQMTTNLMRILAYLSWNEIMAFFYSDLLKPDPSKEFTFLKRLLFLMTGFYYRVLVVIFFQGLDLVVDNTYACFSCGATVNQQAVDFESSQSNTSLSFSENETDLKAFDMAQKFNFTYEHYNPMTKSSI